MDNKDKYDGTVEFTNEEYITILQNLQDWLYFSSMNGGTRLQREAIDKAIKSLSQPELIHCMDCDWWTKQDDSIQGRCALMGAYPTGSWYCGNARRREETDGRD